MDNRYAHLRKRTFDSGTLVFNGAAGITGIARNVSEGGAMLEVESVIGVPDECTLLIEVLRFVHACRAVWRQPAWASVRQYARRPHCRRGGARSTGQQRPERFACVSGWRIRRSFGRPFRLAPLAYKDAKFEPSP